MAPSVRNDAIIIILDVGKSVSELLQDGTTFFEKSKVCISWILKRKIMLNSSAFLSLLLTGTEKSDDYVKNLRIKMSANVSLKYDFQSANWDMLNFVENEVKITENQSDWLGAMAYAVKKLNSLDEFEVSLKRIVLFSNLSHTEENSIQYILEALNESRIDLTVIGWNYMDGTSQEPLKKRARLSTSTKVKEDVSKREKLMKIFDQIENINLCDFDSAVKQLSSYARKEVRPTPWNVIMDVGDLKINVQVFKKIDQKTSVKYKMKCMERDFSKPGGFCVSTLKDVMRDIKMHYIHYNESKVLVERVSVDKDGVIGGYFFGTSIIPYSDHDKAILSFKAGPKCFTVLGFTRISNIPYNILVGEGCYLVAPRQGDEKSEVALSALVNALSETKKVAIVRRVYSNDRGLSLGVLYPVIKESDSDDFGHKEYLVFIEVAYDEDIGKSKPQLLKRARRRISKKQFKAVDFLISKMNLMEAESDEKGDPVEALDLPTRHEINNQAFQHFIYHKALYAGKPLPEKLPDQCLKGMSQPKSIAEQSSYLEEMLRKYFLTKAELDEIKNKTRIAARERLDVLNIRFYEFDDDEERTIEKCCKKLFETQKYPLDGGVANLIKFSVEKFQFKAENVVRELLHYTAICRKKALEDYPEEYNFWMKRLRYVIGIDGEVEKAYWTGIREGNLLLITEEESEKSKTKKDEAEFFLQSLCEKVEETEEEKQRKAEEDRRRGHGDMISKESDATMTTSSPSAAGPQAADVAKGRRFRQRPLGPAPFASFEDLSDELDSPPETARTPLPGIKEDPASQIQTPNTPQVLTMGISLTEKEDRSLKEALFSSLDTPAPPRIDISRASSSSQHEDSVTSSPDRDGAQNLGYKEDGTIDLRSSTEELDYIQEPGTVEESEAKRKREKMMKKQQQLRQDLCETQSEIDVKERKGSSCSVMSDVGLLCISGRTSRLSSIGSVASGGSAASGVSHLSAGSHLSGRSTRSPSPHKMLLETSFCGSKPMHTQSIEIASAAISAMIAEKPASRSPSRPQSRLCSRSPSPHRMLLETSFCGTKQIMPTASTKSKREASVEKVDRKNTNLYPKPAIEVASVNVEEIVAKPVAEIQRKKEDEVKERVPKPKLAKPVNLPKLPDKRNYSKPKKIISIRDIPADEIYIPLKGPEVDFEEIIRKASPHLKRKVEKSSATASSSENVIFIPLHSPTESEKEKMKEEETPTFKQNFDDGIYIPLHSPPKSPKSTKPRIAEDRGWQASSAVERTPPKKEEKKKPKYEVCEDGSIFIPLHSPDEDGKPIRDFEEEIRRVDEELKKARELAEKRLQAEEFQLKPATLDLSESSFSRQTLPTGRPVSDVTPGESRTPSPGSTLSRKSSFASIFRRSDVSGSPDSSGGSLTRKKSGTFSNIIKEAGDGLRDRSRSRSKSRDRQSPSAVVRSPSVKKSVFTNLFGKKKGDEKAISGKAEGDTPNRIDLQYNYNKNLDDEKGFGSQGDYIIIPLRDPSDPSPGLENDIRDESVRINGHEKASSPVVVLEKHIAPKSPVQITEPGEVPRVKTPISAQTPEDVRLSGSVYVRESKIVTKTPVESKIPAKSSNFRREPSPEPEPNQSRHVEGDRIVHCEKDEKMPKEVEKTSESGKGKVESSDLQHDSSLDVEEGSVKEEMMAVSTGGVRKLKLPPEPGDLGDDHERKGLVLQESFEDELPYVPTTLPLERSVGVPIVPVKHRVAELKTCPIERPRSTTPINPSTLEDYVNVREPIRVSAEDKMKISLPREDSLTGKSKSPRRLSAKGKTWFEFAEAVAQMPKDRKSSLTTTPSPPPLPPRSSPPTSVCLSTSAPQATSSWINFEELPEKRKQPKRITTVPPLRSSADGGVLPEKTGASVGGNVIYSYVSPEDCQCECHDHNAHGAGHAKESNSNRGMNTEAELDVNGDLVKNCSLTKNKLMKTQGYQEKSAKNECEECESGRHVDAEEDIEKKPLLEYNSEGENDDSASRRDGDWDLLMPGVRKELDRQSLLSDSSYDCTSQDAVSVGGLDNGADRTGMKPFEMDFDVKSNRSSIVSQDEQVSPE